MLVRLVSVSALFYFSFMMNKIILSLLLLMGCTVGRAQALYDVLRSIPDTMVSYIDAGQRSELADDILAKKSAVVVNSIGDTTSIVRHSGDYVLLRCNKARDMEMKLLPRKQEGDTLLCVVNTYKGPAEESTIAFYTLDWKTVSGGRFVADVPAQSLLHKPDSVSDNDFHHLCDMLDPLLVNIHLSPNNYSLTFSVSIPEVPRDKDKELKDIISQIKFNWDGERFN